MFDLRIVEIAVRVVVRIPDIAVSKLNETSGWDNNEYVSLPFEIEYLFVFSHQSEMRSCQIGAARAPEFQRIVRASEP